MSLSAALARLVVHPDFADLPAPASAAVRRSVLDTLGCVLAGAAAPECVSLRRLLGVMTDAQGATAIGTANRVPAPWAALVNATAGRALDIDDLYEPGQVHASVAVVPAALAVAEALGRRVSGAEFIAAVAAGLEVLARVSMTPLDDIHVTGLSSSYHYGVFAAAAATARLVGGGEAVARNALGLAAGLASGTRQPNVEGVGAFRAQQGWAAHAGVMAGLMAAHGIEGPAESLEGRCGYFAVYHRNRYRPEPVLAPLAPPFAVEALTPKFVPACRFAHGAIEGILALRGAAGDGAQVTRVRVRVAGSHHAAVCEPASRRTPRSASEAQFSLPYLTAAALVRGRLAPADLLPESLCDERVLDWAQRIETTPDAAFASAPLGAAAVDVELAGGRSLSRTVMHPGSDQAADFDATATKIRELVSPVDAPRAVRLIDAVAALDTLSDVRVLADVLRTA